MKAKSLVIICCMFACSGCDKSKEILLPFQFSQEIELTADSIWREELFRIEEWVTTDSMMLIRSSNKYPVFYTYSLPEMKLIESFGYLGRGPGEYLRPHIGRDGSGNVLLYDNANRKLQTLRISKDGHKVEDKGQLNGKELFNALGYIDGELFYGKVENPNYINLNIYNLHSSGEMQISSSCEVVTSETGESGELDFVVAANGRDLAIAYIHKKQMEYYKIRDNNQIEKLRVYGNGRDLQPDIFYYTTITSNSNYFYALCQEFEHGNLYGRSSVELFDKEGNGVIKIRLDRIINNITADETGRVFYAISPFSDDYIYKYTLP